MKLYLKYLLCSLVSAQALASVSVSSPSNNARTASPVHYIASATTSCSKGVSAMGIYTAPSVLAYKVSGAKLNTYLQLSAGTYNTVVQEWDNCGGSSKATITVTVTSSAQIPPSSHVFIVLEENHSYSSVIGNSAMPYLNSLASKYGLATQSYANTHPSIGNYFELTAGDLITTANDSLCNSITQDNIVRHLLTAGKTWKAYAQSLPSVGYMGCSAYPYVRRHNPLSYFSDVANSSEKNNLVPFTAFAGDLANQRLPNYSFIVPDLLHDAHDGTLNAADAWLKANIAPLIASATFQKDGILIITFDEGFDSDTQHGGGHIATVVIGPKVRSGYKSTILYQHQNVLKTLMEALGLTSFPGAASSAAGMNDFF